MVEDIEEIKKIGKEFEINHKESKTKNNFYKPMNIL